jgi:hypothetical protein
MSPGVVVLAAALLVGAVLWLRRAHTVVRLQGGKAELVRGALPPGLLSDLRDVARSTGADGRLEIRGQGPSLALSIKGLDEGPEQRVRNVTLLRKDRIRRP